MRAREASAGSARGRAVGAAGAALVSAFWALVSACVGVSGLAEPGAGGGGAGGVVDPIPTTPAPSDGATSTADGAAPTLPPGDDDEEDEEGEPRDRLARGMFAAEWWEGGKGPKGCDTGRAFDADGGIAATPAVTTQEPLLLFPRADHAGWQHIFASPVPGVGPDFCARFRQRVRLPAGELRFVYRKDDGLRLFLGDRLVVDDWEYVDDNEHTVTVTNPTAGEVLVTVLFRDTSGGATLYVKLLR